MAQNKQQAQWACVKEAQFYAQDVALSSDAPVIGTRCRSGQLFVLGPVNRPYLLHEGFRRLAT
jgi:hypothetical protein